MSAWRDLLGTVSNVFTIGLKKASLDASGLSAPRTFTLPDLAGTVALSSQIAVQPPASVLTSNTVATTETIVARWALTAGYLTARQMLDLSFMGQVSSTATLTFRVRIGTLGTAADALAATFATSAAGVANAYVYGDIKISVLTSTTVTATGSVQLASASVGLLTAAFAAATIAPASALFISLTLVQSLSQTYTSREAALSRMT
jgi:hypothetical protein